MPDSVENIAETPRESELESDALSLLLRRLELHAHVFLRAEFCGRWAVDTSGQLRAPFHLVTRGTGWLHSPGSPPRQLTGGELVLFPHDAKHTFSHSDTPPDPADINQPPPAVLDGPITGLLCGYFEFDRRAAAPLLAGLPTTLVLDLKKAAGHRDTAALVQLWINESALTDLGTDFIIDQLAYVVFVHILREQLANGGLRGPLAALSDPRLGPVLHRIHLEPGEDHNVERLARQAGMSRSTFAHHFKARTGMTPTRYVTHWRMQTATKLLWTSDLSLASIAEKVGYSSEVAFRKAYRAQTGTPPGQVRREGRAATG